MCLLNERMKKGAGIIEDGTLGRRVIRGAESQSQVAQDWD